MHLRLEKIQSTLLPNSTLISDSTLLDSYLQGTEGLNHFTEKKRSLFAVAIISDQAEVDSILSMANQCAGDSELNFTIYPISTGNNWGYGTSQPTSVENNILLLDLSHLNKISEFDAELGLVTLEPGVTQQQLSDYLISLGDEYMVPVTGAGPDCSILANALERGYGITPYTEHFAAVSAIHGYWADGTAYQSAVYQLDQSENKSVDRTFKWGLGPYMEGLFTQSSLGIVTKMTIRLAKKKAAFTSFFVQMQSDSQLEFAVPLIRKVLQNYEGTVGSINLMDKRRILSMFAENPSNDIGTVNNHTVMSSSDVDDIAKQLQTPSWTIVGSIYGSTRVVKAVKKEINAIFKTIPSKRIFSDSLLITSANRVINWLPDWFIKKSSALDILKQQLSSFNKGKEIMLGKPNKVALKLAYWRHPNASKYSHESLSPAADGCGLLWYAPLVTMKAEKMREFVTFVREVCPRHNIEPFITFTNLKHDCIDSTIPIVFDLSNPDAVRDAHNCLKELVLKGLEKGFVPYRLNIDQQQWLLNKDDSFWQTANKLKATLDPNNILSVGRYNPS